MSFLKSEKFWIGFAVAAVLIGTNVGGVGSKLTSFLPKLG